MLDIRKYSNTTCTTLADTYISAIRTIFFGVVSIAQVVEVTDSALLGDVVEVVSSIPAVGHKIFFSIWKYYIINLGFSKLQQIFRPRSILLIQVHPKKVYSREIKK